VEDVGRIRIYRSDSQKLVGDINLADGQLDLDIPDEGLREWLQTLLDQVGEVTLAWTPSGEGGWTEHRAEPRTTHWLRFVSLNVLIPMGYQVDFRPRDEG
jgi:hypothetical protein